MRIAFLTPLPPARTGIAVYSAYVLPALARRAAVTAVVDQQDWEAPPGCEVVSLHAYRSGEFDAVIYQLGNNPYHEWIYRQAMEVPGIIELHDVVLHHMLVEMTLAKGDAGAYTDVLRENHGAAGEAWARGRIAGYHAEIGNFLFPSSTAVADRSTHVIVHNRYAAEVMARNGVTAPLTVLNMPFPAPAAPPPAPHEGVLIGMFGFITDAKRPEVVFRAFAEARNRDPRLHLLVVGEPAPSLDLLNLARGEGIPADAWSATGYVGEEDFDHHLASVDRVVNLRYPTAGETSGALLHILHAGKQVAISDYGPFTDIPEQVASRIPFGRGEHDALVDFMLYGTQHDADAQRGWVSAHNDLENAVETYVRLASGDLPRARPHRSASNAIPLFPSLRVEGSEPRRDALELRLANVGGQTVSSTQFGVPGYRLIAKFFRGGREIESRWVELPRDLAPGTVLTLRIPLAAEEGELRLYHALQGIPDIDREPFALIEVGP